MSSTEPSAIRTNNPMRAFHALWAAWTCIGPARPSPAAMALPPRAILWALPWLGLILGLVWTLLFAGAWRTFGEYPAGLRLVPMLAVVLTDLLLTGRITMAAVRVIESHIYNDENLLQPRRRDITSVGVFAAVSLILATFVLLVAVPKGIEWWPADWRQHLHWVYPRPIFRPLVLMPMWACWSMVLAAGIGPARPADSDAPAPLDRLAGRATPGQIFAGFLMPAALTAVYASRDMNLVIGLGIALVVFVSVYIAAMTFALRWRGQTGTTLLATALTGRLAFILCWLFVGRALHGW